jgi:homoserine kinase type II
MTSIQASSELLQVLDRYDLGMLTRSTKDERGTVNTSYVIEMEKGGQRRTFFLRRYKAAIQEQEILFEHSLLTHLAERGTCPVAGVLPTREGPTFLHFAAVPGSPPAFYAIFEFLPGEDRYSWVDPHCTESELRASGRLLAQFHSDAQSFEPSGRREEPRTAELLSRIDAMWAEASESSKGTVFDRCVQANFDLMQEEIRSTLAVLTAPKLESLPETFVHSDYHPGNLRFSGRSISGLVDFDWAKRDWRSYDVALALWYFCVSWRRPADGRLRLADAGAFLAAYQGRLLEGAEISPLTPLEIRYMPDLLRAANIYVLYWTLRDYLGKIVDPVEYVVYLRHHVASARWLGAADNRRRVESMLAGLPG